MKILITGGAGYLGNTLVRRLLTAVPAAEIVVYDNLSRNNYGFFGCKEKLSAASVSFVEGEILDGRRLRQSLAGVDAVVHLAAKVITPFTDQEAHSFEQINHWGTAQLVEAIEQTEVEQVIYLSSVSVYGSSEAPVDETAPPQPQTFYGISKLRGEEQLRRLEQRCKVHIIRSANVFGYSPTMRYDAVVNRFMFEANFKGRIVLEGSGEQARSFIHLGKICDVLTQLFTKSVPAGTYNAVEHNLSIRAIADKVAALYPRLERLELNRNMPMRSIRVKVPCRICDHVQFETGSLEEELRSLKARFTF